MAVSYFAQLCSSRAGRRWPGRLSIAELPEFGEYDEHLAGSGPLGDYCVRVWAGPVVVLSQSCEIQQAHDEDSRLVVAPLVTPEQWQEGPWDAFRKGLPIPGYHYLPKPDEAEREVLAMPEDQESEYAVVFASQTLTHRGLITAARFARIVDVVALQDSYARSTTIRGLASTRELGGLEGKRIVSALETPVTNPGPVRLAKVHLVDDSDGSTDEITVAWGVRSLKKA